MDLILTCGCGKEMKIDLSALGRTGRCAHCGMPITVGANNTRPMPEPVAPQAATDACVRCGRAFRGEWDRVMRESGHVCHICANLTHELDALRVQPESPPPDLETTRMFAQPGWEAPAVKLSEEELAAQQKQRNREMLIYGVAAVIVIGATVLMPERSADEAAAKMSQASQVLVQAVTIATGVVAQIAGLYWTLQWGQKLPNERFLLNLIAVGAIGAVLHAMSMLHFTGPYFGLILLYFLYDFGLGDVLRFIVFSTIARLMATVAGIGLIQMLA